MILRVKDEKGQWVDIPAIVGPKGDSYVLTEEDKTEIAEIALLLIPSSEEVSY